MKKNLTILLITISLLMLNSLVTLADECTISASQVNGVTVLNATGCKEVVLKMNGIQVYPIIAATETPIAQETASIPEIFDQGSENPFTDKASLHITYKDAGYVNVHIHPDFRKGYVVNDLQGRALAGRYYPIVCSGTDNWYQIRYNQKYGWVHIKGNNIYAEVVNPNKISIPVCK